MTLMTAVALAIPSVASAALVLQTPSTPRVLTFNEVVNDTAIGGARVFGFNPTTTFGVISEGSASDTGTTGFRSPSVSVRGSGLAFGTVPAGAWTPFADDLNGDGNTFGNIVVSGLVVARGPGGSGGGVLNVAPLGAGNTGILFGQANAAPFRDNGVTLKLKNGTGAAMTGFTLAMDLWYGDPDTQLSNFAISYSTDNATYTPITTLAGLRTTTASFDVAQASHWSSNFNVAESVVLPSPIAADGLLYVRMESLRIGGTGSAGNWLMDNVAVAAVVPEPASLSLLGLAGLALVRRRK